MALTQIKNLSYRPQDLVYDPLFVVSGPRDHYKASIIAEMAMAKYQVCPVFSNMFSDLPSYPRKQLVLRKPRDIPTYKEQKEKSDKYFQKIHNSKPLQVQGADRPKFFRFPVVTYPSEVIPYLYGPTFTLERIPKHNRLIKGGKMNENIQTDFRDSETQTSPWQPDFKLIRDENDGSVTPQLLKLDFLKWGSGLPAGQREVILIERARMKRAWEKHLPAPTNEALLNKRRNIIEAMERDEWAFREQEIQEIQNLRMQLLENMLAEIHQKANDRNYTRLKNMAEIKRKETDEKIQKLRREAQRELRKLDLKHRGVIKKYHTTDVVEEHAHPKSELYAPLMRHGEHPMRWHQILDERLKYYKAQFIGVEDFNTLPRWLNNAVTKGDRHGAKPPGTQMCIRETKWTAPVLKKLHEELKNLHKTAKRKCTLRVRIERSFSEASTPETLDIPDDEDEEKYQSIIAIQSLLKGRASQMLIYEGRDKCRELIKELKYSTGLLDEQRESIAESRKNIKHQQRDEAIQQNRISKLQKALNKLEGSIVGSLLDFLNKELRRLLDERRAHAICFLNERERNDREAAEAGRRQQELRRRREHDEIFKQMVKVHQDNVDLYLQDIITEGIEFASNDEAIFYVKKLSEKINEDNAEELEKSINVSDQEEMIADLVHHFVLPEVQKQLVRDRIKKKQTQNLKTVFDTFHDEFIEEIPEPKSDTIEGIVKSEEEELPPTGFEFQFATDTELMENLWKDVEHPTLVSGTVSSVEEELSSEVFSEDKIDEQAADESPITSNVEAEDLDVAEKVSELSQASFTEIEEQIIELQEKKDSDKIDQYGEEFREIFDEEKETIQKSLDDVQEEKTDIKEETHDVHEDSYAYGGEKEEEPGDIYSEDRKIQETSDNEQEHKKEIIQGEEKIVQEEPGDIHGEDRKIQETPDNEQEHKEEMIQSEEKIVQEEPGDIHSEDRNMQETSDNEQKHKEEMIQKQDDIQKDEETVKNIADNEEESMQKKSDEVSSPEKILDADNIHGNEEDSMQKKPDETTDPEKILDTDKTHEKEESKQERSDETGDAV